MDIREFSNNDFDTNSWVNNILKNGESHDNIENYTTSLVMKLQLYVQQVNNALEDTSQQILQSLPKILNDTNTLKEEAAELQKKMILVRDRVTSIENETGKTINTIEQLDSCKLKLYNAKQSLHESDNWTVLVNDLEELFDTKNIAEISRKIAGMQQSLKLLVNVADYEDRKLQLEGLKNRLEALASPLIVQAFNKNSKEDSLTYVRIFGAMKRVPQLIKYYHKTQKDILLKRWRNELESELECLQYISNYFDFLVQNWQNQTKWCLDVFHNQTPTNDILSAIYIDVLTSLDPNLNVCIDATLKQVVNKLEFIQEVKEVFKQFARKMEPIPQLQKAIYKPFRAYVVRYADYELALLLKRLSNVNCLKDDLSNTIQALGMSITEVIDIAREAKTRCNTVTEYCGYSGLLTALRGFFLKYIDQYRVALRQIERGKIEGEDWNTFQLCFYLMQHSGEVILKLKVLEKELTETILQVKDLEFKVYFLDRANRRELDSLIKCVVEGTKLSLLDHVTSEVGKFCSDIYFTTQSVVFSPIILQLATVQLPFTWSKFTSNTSHSDLPEYGITPQEYITEIGQYFITLPQHLEPFLFKENPSLACALKSVTDEYNIIGDVEGALADVFLKMVAKKTCTEFCDRILSICELSMPACRQLSHDIGYLNNVFQDLGLSLTDNLQQILVLLKLSPEQYQSESTGCSARYVAAIRQMRNITSN